MIPGEVVGERFELVELAQAGGMGAVWRARDRLTGEIVALKLLRAGGAGHDERFLREAALLAELRHPAIVRHVAHGRVAGGVPYLAMEWLEGEDLAHRLRAGPLAAADAIALVRRAADALALLHGRGGLHRDLKPSNLFLDGGRPERVKLLDFGIARTGHSHGLTQTGSIMGTPGYTAPEQARGLRDIDARADVFALGCVLHECLTGRPAFRGEHVMAVLARILLDEPPRLSDVLPDVAPELEAVVARLLHKDPARRPRDGREVAELLDRVAAGPAAIVPIGPLTPRPPSLGSDEQRFMCLVLCTVADPGAVGELATLSPALSSVGDDPTLLPGVAPTPEQLAALVRAHGGRLERLADGSWVALADRQHERAPATDQAAQAARCALALARALPTARVAIASGRGVNAGRAPVGEVIDRALALVDARAAAAGAVVAPVHVDALTAGLLGGRFELRDDGGALTVVAERLDAEPERRVLGRPTPCVGRDRELATLIGLFDECASEPCARAVVVRAPAGYGKSRLRAELAARLRARGAAFEWLYGRGDPLHSGSPFALAAQLVRRAAGIVEGEALEAKRGRLTARLGEVVPESYLARVATFLGELAHVPVEDDAAALAAARRDPVVMGDQLRRAFEDWLAAETARRPVVLVLEDLHLGDLSTVKLVDSALRNLRERALLVVALARPEIELVFPGLWSERGPVEIPLPELSRRAATRLVREVLGAEVDEATVERIVAQAAGNAFYLEELCRVTRLSPDGELPGTVLAMAQARLEGVDPESRRVLRAAAVFGNRFPRGGLLALGGDPEAGGVLDRLLGELCERELIEPHAADYRGERTYEFRHALVREAAYAMLTEADRRLGHRLAAEWLASAGETDDVLLAEHFERGGLPERAVAGWLRAARDALEGNDLAAVLTRVERGLVCGARGDVLGELLALRAEAHRWRADYTAAVEAASLAMAALPAGSPVWCAAATAAMTSLHGISSHDRLDELLDRVVAAPVIAGGRLERLRAIGKGAVQLYLAGRYERGDEMVAILDAELRREPTDDALVTARTAEARAFREGARADQGRALALLEVAAEAYERAGDLRHAWMTRGNLGYTYSQLGDFARAVAILEATRREAERMGIAYIHTVVQQNLGFALAHLGQLERAEMVQRTALLAFRAQQDTHMAGVSATYLAQIRALAGDHAGAEREAAAASEVLVGNPPGRALALATVARARVALGRAEAAVAPAREAYAILESLGGMDEGEMLVRLALAESLAATGRADEARAVLAVALARLDDLAGKLPDALRAMYLERVPENAALRRLAAG